MKKSELKQLIREVVEEVSGESTHPIKPALHHSVGARVDGDTCWVAFKKAADEARKAASIVELAYADYVKLASSPDPGYAGADRAYVAYTNAIAKKDALDAKADIAYVAYTKAAEGVGDVAAVNENAYINAAHPSNPVRSAVTPHSKKDNRLVFKDNKTFLDGKEVELRDLKVGDVHTRDYPDFSDAFIEAGTFVDGTDLSDEQLEYLTAECPELVNELAHESLHESVKGEARKIVNEINSGEPICPPHLRDLSLRDLETRYRAGGVSESDLRAYLKAWNATPGRFTQAVWSSGAIRQFDPEKGNVYPHLAAEFGVVNEINGKTPSLTENTLTNAWHELNARVRGKTEGEYGPFTNADWQNISILHKSIEDLEKDRSELLVALKWAERLLDENEALMPVNPIRTAIQNSEKIAATKSARPGFNLSSKELAALRAAGQLKVKDEIKI